MIGTYMAEDDGQAQDMCPGPGRKGAACATASTSPGTRERGKSRPKGSRPATKGPDEARLWCLKHPVVLGKNKDEKWWFCIGYRQLNAEMLHDVYPLSRIDESRDALAGSRYFSTLDLIRG